MQPNLIRSEPDLIGKGCVANRRRTAIDSILKMVKNFVTFTSILGGYSSARDEMA